MNRRLPQLIPGVTARVLVSCGVLCGCGLICGCGVEPSRELETLLRQAETELQSGDGAAAQATVKRGLGLATARADAVSQCKFRLLRADVLLTDKKTDKALPDLLSPLPPGPEFSSLRARQKMLEGRAMILEQCWDDAARILDDARLRAQNCGDIETLVNVEILQGSRLIYLKQGHAADQRLQSALHHAQEKNLHYYEAGILLNFGRRHLLNQRYDEAVEYFERASSLDPSHATTPYFGAQTNLAICYYRLGDFDRALQTLLRLLDQRQLAQAGPYYEAALGETGNTYLLKGDEPHAAEYLERALTAAKEVGSNSHAAIWAGNLATVYADLADWDKAEHFNKEAMGIKKASPNNSLVYNTLNSAAIAIGRGHYAEGEGLYQDAIASSKENPAVRWEAYDSLGHSAVLQNQLALACRRFESAVDIVEQAHAEISKTEYQLTFLTRLIRLYGEYVEALVAQGDYDHALAVADSSRAQVLAQRFGSPAVRRLPASQLRKIAEESDSTIVTYWLGSKRSYAWVVSPSAIHHADLPPGSEIAALVEEYSEAIERRLADPIRTRIPAGEKLFQKLVEPLQKWLPKGSRIVIVPDGVLGGLNFETLPVSGEKPGAARHFWIEDATITVSPAIGVLGVLSHSAPHSASEEEHGNGLLLIGDPENADPDFPPLANAPAEIANVLRYFVPESRLVLRKKDAVPQAYRAADPGRFAVIHFTAHAIANQESPLDSAVVLTGGKLYARELMALPLKSDLVTFSACRGVGTRTYGGEGLVGFAWAFLRAGARNVIAGLWDVNDESTAKLMDVTYREMAAGRKVQDALRAAKIELIESGKNFRKPYYWGPFQVYTLAPELGNAMRSAVN